MPEDTAGLRDRLRAQLGSQKRLGNASAFPQRRHFNGCRGGDHCTTLRCSDREEYWEPQVIIHRRILEGCNFPEACDCPDHAAAMLPDQPPARAIVVRRSVPLLARVRRRLHKIWRWFLDDPFCSMCGTRSCRIRRGEIHFREPEQDCPTCGGVVGECND